MKNNVLSMFSHVSLADKALDGVPEDTKAMLKCFKKNTREYCFVRHTHDGHAGCIASDRATAEAIDWKNNKLHGLRNDCKFKVEVAQFERSDGTVLIRVSAEPGETFAINFRSNGMFYRACRSPL